MSLGSYIVRNALRNKRRFVLTVFSVTLSLFLLTVLLVMLRGLTEPATTDDAALRIVVRHKVSLANMLFSKYKTRIERMPGVKYCTKLLWFGGIYQDEKNFFPQFACDAPMLFKVLSEARVDPEQLQRFIARADRLRGGNQNDATFRMESWRSDHVDGRDVALQPGTDHPGGLCRERG